MLATEPSVAPPPDGHDNVHERSASQEPPEERNTEQGSFSNAVDGTEDRQLHSSEPFKLGEASTNGKSVSGDDEPPRRQDIPADSHHTALSSSENAEELKQRTESQTEVAPR